jgi:hypothetical protein
MRRRIEQSARCESAQQGGCRLVGMSAARTVIRLEVGVAVPGDVADGTIVATPLPETGHNVGIGVAEFRRFAVISSVQVWQPRKRTFVVSCAPVRAFLFEARVQVTAVC